ncbi:MAG: cobalamin-binding protein [Dehalococcoidia bacterium]
MCLTAETTEVVFTLGAGDRVVGVTGYAVRPPEARKKPKVAAFRSGNVARILELRPDLVLGFSDLQADLAADLIRAGVTVLVTNQRTLAETASAIEMLGSVIGLGAAGAALAQQFRDDLEGIQAANANLERRPRVWFEEWDEPLIGGIGWAGELIALAGGVDVFPELGRAQGAAGRIVDSREVLRRAPEIIVGSWCGKRFIPARVAARPGWDGLEAVREGRLYEIKAPDILQPGPSLVRGARQLAAIVASYSATGRGSSGMPGSIAK